MAGEDLQRFGQAAMDMALPASGVASLPQDTCFMADPGYGHAMLVHPDTQSLRKRVQRALSRGAPTAQAGRGHRRCWHWKIMLGDARGHLVSQPHPMKGSLLSLLQAAP